jgi:hypothetical protein
MARNLHRGRFDLTAYDQDGQRTLLVEVKRRSAGSAWATEYRSNLVKRGLLSGTESFLFVTPDQLFLWPPHALPDTSPAHELDAHPLLLPYFQRVGVSPKEIQPVAFEMLVLLWLQELSNSEPSGVPLEVTKSGLFALIHKADIEHEPEM